MKKPAEKYGCVLAEFDSKREKWGWIKENMPELALLIDRFGAAQEPDIYFNMDDKALAPSLKQDWIDYQNTLRILGESRYASIHKEVKDSINRRN